jgi:hypothetical protein
VTSAPALGGAHAALLLEALAFSPPATASDGEGGAVVAVEARGVTDAPHAAAALARIPVLRAPLAAAVAPSLSFRGALRTLSPASGLHGGSKPASRRPSTDTAAAPPAAAPAEAPAAPAADDGSAAAEGALDVDAIPLRLHTLRDAVGARVLFVAVDPSSGAARSLALSLAALRDATLDPFILVAGGASASASASASSQEAEPVQNVEPESAAPVGEVVAPASDAPRGASGGSPLLSRIRLLVPPATPLSPQSLAALFAQGEDVRLALVTGGGEA